MEQRGVSLRRREFLGMLAGGAAAAAMARYAPGAARLALPRTLLAAGATAERARPNILFIAVDDMNDWGVSYLAGRQGVHTPNLDRLSARGILFTNAHCSAPACNPSRASLMTGIRPSTSGVYHNNQDWRVNPVLRSVPTLPEHFRAHGYTAVGGGKIFHALEWDDGETDGYNDAKCWDAYFPSMKRQMPHRVLPPGKLPLAQGTSEKRGAPGFFDWGPIGRPIETMPDHKVVDWAIGELKKTHEKPFFQAVGIFRPHIPWYVPKQFFDLYPLDAIQVPYVKEGWLEKLPPASQNSGAVRRRWHQWVVESGEWQKAVQGYLASISFTDWQLGRLLEALDASAYAENTVAVLWTDNGFHLGDKETWEKFTLWEESTRVPLIFVVPGLTRPDTRCSRPASLLDVYPTLVEVAGLAPNPRLEGVSLVAQLRDPDAPRQEPAVTTQGRNNHAVRSERYRYIRYDNGDEELYDHQHDPGEWDNLAGDSKHNAVKKELAAWLPKVNAPDSAGGT